ncbi:MAG: DNA methyltransferase [Brucella intermedia]
MSDEGDRAYDTGEKCLAAYINNDHRLFRADGGRHLFGKAHLDLIAEWIDEPAGNDNAPATKPAIVGVVLDPFGGAGTTALVAERHGRNAILIELNPEYASLTRRRLNRELGMFARIESNDNNPEVANAA